MNLFKYLKLINLGLVTIFLFWGLKANPSPTGKVGEVQIKTLPQVKLLSDTIIDVLSNQVIPYQRHYKLSSTTYCVLEMGAIKSGIQKIIIYLERKGLIELEKAAGYMEMDGCPVVIMNSIPSYWFEPISKSTVTLRIKREFPIIDDGDVWKLLIKIPELDGQTIGNSVNHVPSDVKAQEFKVENDDIYKFVDDSIMPYVTAKKYPKECLKILVSCKPMGWEVNEGHKQYMIAFSVMPEFRGVLPNLKGVFVYDGLEFILISDFPEVFLSPQTQKYRKITFQEYPFFMDDLDDCKVWLMLSEE